MFIILLILYEIEGSNPVITPKDVLEELRRCNGQITDYGRPAGPFCSIPLLELSIRASGSRGKRSRCCATTDGLRPTILVQLNATGLAERELINSMKPNLKTRSTREMHNMATPRLFSLARIPGGPVKLFALPQPPMPFLSSATGSFKNIQSPSSTVRLSSTDSIGNDPGRILLILGIYRRIVADRILDVMWY
jgi:hypothetical protein